MRKREREREREKKRLREEEDFENSTKHILKHPASPKKHKSEKDT
jgi:hypothetical protein